MDAYLTFDGNAGEAMDFYAKCLDGEIITKSTFGESPMAAEMPVETHGRMVHVSLEAHGQTLMASDTPPGTPSEGYKGFSLSLNADTVEEGKKAFDALAEGGEVTMPFGPSFWAAGFGMLTDKYGVPWMVNCHGAAEA